MADSGAASEGADEDVGPSSEDADEDLCACTASEPSSEGSGAGNAAAGNAAVNANANSILAGGLEGAVLGLAAHLRVLGECVAAVAADAFVVRSLMTKIGRDCPTPSLIYA